MTDGHATGRDEAMPTAEQLREMTDLERSNLGAQLDHIDIVFRVDPPGEPGSKIDKRSERTVAGFFLLTFVASVAFIVIYIAWPWEYSKGDDGFFAYWTYTPALGISLALALFGLAMGLVMWGRLLLPHEDAAEERHDGLSQNLDRETAEGTMRDTLTMTGLGRRTMLRRSLGLAGGALGVLAVVPLGGLIKRPRGMFDTPWKEGVRLTRDNGKPLRPQDMEAGSLETVFPGVEGGNRAADAPVMLIRLRPDQKVTPRKGQEDFGWGDYVAYSKICTHAGCPVSLYEQETGRILCPCHQSQFDVTQDAKPIFGPATRSLPMLPITLDDQGYFIARGDFREAIGPAFWERP